MASLTVTPAADQPIDVPRGLFYAAFVALILLQFVYLFSFNWFPDLRMPLSSAITGIHFALAAVTLMIRPEPWNLLLLLSSTLIILTIIPAHALGFGSMARLDMAEVIRVLVVPIMLVWIMAFPLALPNRLLWFVAVVGTLLGAYLAFTGEPVMVSLTPRLGSITGGLDQMHPSAKFMALQFILADLLRRARIMAPALAFALMALCIVVLLGFGARAQFLLVIGYFAALGYFAMRRVVVVRWAPILILVLVVTAATIALMVGEDTSSWGSGRVGAWQYRLVIIGKWDVLKIIFGGGIGADKVWDPEWWWAEDGMISHNDYLYIFMDHGIFGLLSYVFFFWALWLRSFNLGRAILVGMAISSFFDNGYVRTPLLMTWLAIILATSVLASLRQGPLAPRPAGTESSTA